MRKDSILWADALGAWEPLRRLAECDFVDSPTNRYYLEWVDRVVADYVAGTFKVPEDQSKRRTGCSLTGRMAFAYAHPWSRFHGNEVIRDQAKTMLLAVAQSQHETGKITTRGECFGAYRVDEHSEVLSHEEAWNLEPLILAALWLGAELTPEEQDRVKTMVRRVMEMFVNTPFHEVNNREICRCAVLALGGRFLNDECLIAAAREQFHWASINVFDEATGQIFEGSGPDGNYSSVSAVYGFLYQAMMEDEVLEARWQRTPRWITWAMDDRGNPVTFAASTRFLFGLNNLCRYLPLLERAAVREPHLRWMIDEVYLQHTQPVPAAADVFCYAMLAHQNGPSAKDPGWFDRHCYPGYLAAAGPEFACRNEGVDSLQFILRESYLTSVGVMGRMPYKGLQHWGYDGEEPILWPTQKAASTTLALGVDTAEMNVSGTKTRDKLWQEGEPCTLIARWKKVWHFYIFTPVSTVLIIDCPMPYREDVWIMDAERCKRPLLAGNSVVFEGRRGRIFWSGGGPAELSDEAGYYRLKTGQNERVMAYAFSDARFAWKRVALEAGELEFEDASGCYRVGFQPAPESAFAEINQGYNAKLAHRAVLNASKR